MGRFLFILLLVWIMPCSLWSEDSQTPWESRAASLPNHNNLAGISIEAVRETLNEAQLPVYKTTPAPVAKTPDNFDSTPWYTEDLPNHIDVPGVVVETINEAITPPPVVVDIPPGEDKVPEKSPATKLTSGNYILRANDILVVSIYGEPTSRRPVTVDPTGRISYLFVNSLPAQGKTIGELRLDLEEALTKYYKAPLVAITLVEAARNYFTILGEVMQAGRYPIVGRTTLLNAMAISGGFKLQEYRFETYDQADLSHSFLARNGRYVPIDFERLVTCGDLTQDVPLEDNDYIYISPSSLDKVYVLGEVKRPAYIQYFHTMSLVEAIAEAGGVNLRASSRVAVLRGSLCCPTQFLIDLNLIVKGYACDFTLEPGDIVYVPAFRFNTAKEIIRSAISTFVGTVASVAGSRAFIATTPRADNSNLVQPVPVINIGGAGTGGFVTPINP